MATADSLLAAAQARGTTAASLATNAIAATSGALGEASSAINNIRLSTPTIHGGFTSLLGDKVLKPILPAGDFATEVTQAFDHAFGSFNSVVTPQVQQYLTTFFPALSALITTDSDLWITNTLENGDGLPVAAVTALVNRATDHETKLAATAVNGIINGTASRGFMAPPGAVNAALANANVELSAKLNSLARDITIKSYDAMQENARFAVQEAVSLRTSFLTALSDFLKLATQQPNQAVDYAGLILKAKTGLYDSAVGLYSAEIREDLGRYGVTNTTRAENASIIRQTMISDSEYMDKQVNAARLKADVALSAATTLSNIAASATASQTSILTAGAAV
jgi:hypothetical protein